MKREGFPLQWPDWIERSKKTVRSQFKTTLGKSRDGIFNQVKLLGGKDVAITTNIPVKLDGQLYANGQPVAGEKAIAVYFTWLNTEYVIACDNYDKLEDNLRAAEKIIEAIRKIEMWGNKITVQQAFKGFKAELPQYAGETTHGDWWQVLHVDKNADAGTIIDAYKRLAKHYHPDNIKNGNRDMFELIQKAFEDSKNK